VGFVALGDTALALAAVGCTRGMEAVLPRVAEQVRDAIAAPRGRARSHCPEALQARPAARRRLAVQASPLTRKLGHCSRGRTSMKHNIGYALLPMHDVEYVKACANAGACFRNWHACKARPRAASVLSTRIAQLARRA